MEQYVKQPPMTERQIEWMQEQLFEESGPFYQLSTKPLENDLIFTEDEERRVAVNLMAISAKEFRIEILAYALMSNHFHFIVRGELVEGLAFFNRLKKRLSNYFSSFPAAQGTGSRIEEQMECLQQADRPDRPVGTACR